MLLPFLRVVELLLVLITASAAVLKVRPSDGREYVPAVG